MGLAFFYVAVLSPHSVVEAGVGLVVAALAGVLTRHMAIRAGLLFQPPAHWVRRLASIPSAVILDTAALAYGLGRGLLPHHRVPGRFWVLPFRAGTHGGTDVARRAIVCMAGSLAPNTYVVYIDLERNRLLVHQLVSHKRQFAAADPEWPV